MKRLQYILLATLSVFMFMGCEQEREPVALPGDAPILNEPSAGKSLVFDEEKATDQIKITWSDADFGFQSATTYVLQFDWANNEFKTPIDIATTNATEISLSVAELNTKMLAFGLPHSVATSVEARVMSFISPLVDTLYSETMSLQITPYEVIIIYPSIYVPGSYQAASGYTKDWDPATAPELYSLLSNNRYEGYVHFESDGGMFKFTDEPNWDLNWGDDELNGSLEKNGKDIPIPSAGYYKMNVNLNDMTYSITKTHWGAIGSATPGGWDQDTDMVYDKETKVWTVTMNLTAGDLKFRANDDWVLNYGDDKANLSLEAGGANIVIAEAGSYTITLNLSVPVYTYRIVKN